MLFNSTDFFVFFGVFLLGWYVVRNHLAARNWLIVIASLIFYSGDLFPQWKGSALAGGLSSQSLVRIAVDGETAREAERFDMGQRIRAVAEGADGAIWLLEDGEGGRLLRLTPRR